MKNRFYLFIAFCAAFFAAQDTQAQGVRYHDKIFNNVTVTTDTFSTVYAGLTMDVYQPTGDSLCHRPLIVFAHEGSFTGGDKNSDNTVVTECQNFAKRGYVTASINYRLGNTFSMLGPADSSYAENIVMQAIGDGKAAVRYFRKDAYTANKYRIDTNLIFGGGNSAGAVLFMNYIFITDVNQVEPALQTTITANGGLEGNSGNEGYSSAINACLSYAGGLSSPSFVTANSKPIAHFQGTTDNVVPYTCANAEGGAVYVRLCGLGSLDQLYTDNGVTHISVPFQGVGHVPWDNSPGDLQIVDSVSRDFLDSITTWPSLSYCGLATGLQNITTDDLISVYPNPAQQQVTVYLPDLQDYNKIQLTDDLGRVVTEKQPVNVLTTFERGNVAAGIYFIKVIKKDATGIVRKVVFQ